MPYKPGQILLDKYRIESLVGRGAFAEVYRATHLSLNATRALKVLHRDAPGVGSTEYSDFRQRFQLEAQLGAQLDHPNVIRIYDFEQQHDTLLLVMAYATGGSLAERLTELHKTNVLMPVDDVLHIALDIAEGLAALHGLDAVHRDLKPSNVLFDADGQAKIADFGLAQISHGPSMRSQLSQPLPHPGTPAYMSPEQQTAGNYLTPASDVYALGTIIFEMLVGRVYRNTRPGVSLRSLRPDTPVWLEEALLQMLNEDPQMRPWDGTEAVALLKAQNKGISSAPVIVPTPIETRPVAHPAPTTEQNTSPSTPSPKHVLKPWQWAVGIVTLLVVLIGGLALLISSIQPQSSPMPTGEPTKATMAIPTATPTIKPDTKSTPASATSAASSTSPESTSMPRTETVAIQVAINADGDVSLNMSEPYIALAETFDASESRTISTVRQEIAGRLLLIRVDRQITTYRLADELQFKIEVADNAAYQVKSLEYAADGDILLEVDAITSSLSTQSPPLDEYTVMLCTAASFDGLQCRSMMTIFPNNTQAVYATWQSRTALANRTSFTRRWYKDDVLLLESIHNAGQTERWTPSDGVSYYVYLSATEGTGQTLFNSSFLPTGRYTFELLANGQVVDVVEFEIR